MHAWIPGQLRVVEFFLQLGDIFQIDVIDTLIEEQGKDVAAKFGMIHPAAQQVCGFGKKSVEFGLGETPLRPRFYGIIHFHIQTMPIFQKHVLKLGFLGHGRIMGTPMKLCVSLEVTIGDLKIYP
jgi:hypothetical protein